MPNTRPWYSKLYNWLDRLFTEYMLIRRLLVLWAMSLITYVILRVFEDLTEITTPVTAALSIVVGLLATVVAFYNYQRRLDKGLVAKGEVEPCDPSRPRPWPPRYREYSDDGRYIDPEDDMGFPDH